MANAAKGEAVVKLSDGTELLMVYDFDALCEVEDVADQAIGDILKELSVKDKSPKLKIARALIYGGLKRHQPDITLEEVSDLMMGGDAGVLTAAMEKAMVNAFPKAAPKVKANPRKTRPGTGTSS